MSLLVFLFNYVNWNIPPPLRECRKKLWCEFELVLSCSEARQYTMEIWTTASEGKRRISLTRGDEVGFVYGLKRHRETTDENKWQVVQQINKFYSSLGYSCVQLKYANS